MSGSWRSAVSALGRRGANGTVALGRPLVSHRRYPGHCRRPCNVECVRTVRRRRDSQAAVAAYCTLRHHRHLHCPGRRLRAGHGVLPGKQHDVLGSKFFNLPAVRHRPSCRPSAVLGEAVGRRGLTMRSSRSRFVTQSTWQVQLAMCFAPLRVSA